MKKLALIVSAILFATMLLAQNYSVMTQGTQTVSGVKFFTNGNLRVSLVPILDSEAVSKSYVDAHTNAPVSITLSNVLATSNDGGDQGVTNVWGFDYETFGTEALFGPALLPTGVYLDGAAIWYDNQLSLKWGDRELYDTNGTLVLSWLTSETLSNSIAALGFGGGGSLTLDQVLGYGNVSTNSVTLSHPNIAVRLNGQGFLGKGTYFSPIQIFTTNISNNAEIQYARFNPDTGSTNIFSSGWDIVDTTNSAFIVAGYKTDSGGADWTTWDKIAVFVGGTYQGAITYGNRFTPTGGWHSFIGNGATLQSAVQIVANNATGYGLSLSSGTNRWCCFNMNGLEWWTDIANTNETAGVWYERLRWTPSSTPYTNTTFKIESSINNAAWRRRTFLDYNGNQLLSIDPYFTGGYSGILIGTNRVANIPVGIVGSDGNLSSLVFNFSGSILIGTNNAAAAQLRIGNNGTIAFGDGTNARDTYLYRSAVNTLSTPGTFTAGTFSGNGSGLTNLQGSAIVGNVATANFATNAGKFGGFDPAYFWNTNSAVPFLIYTNAAAPLSNPISADAFAFQQGYGLTRSWSVSNGIAITTASIDTNSVITTNGGSFAGSIYQTGGSALSPAGTELVTANWVRSLLRDGSYFYVSTNQTTSGYANPSNLRVYR